MGNRPAYSTKAFLLGAPGVHPLEPPSAPRRWLHRAVALPARPARGARAPREEYSPAAGVSSHRARVPTGSACQPHPPARQATRGGEAPQAQAAQTGANVCNGAAKLGAPYGTGYR